MRFPMLFFTEGAPDLRLPPFSGGSRFLTNCDLVLAPAQKTTLDRWGIGAL
jgi:hypothetical protein